MSFANIGDVQLFFMDEGRGEPMLLVHGYTCDSHDWSWQLPLFESKYRVVASVGPCRQQQNYWKRN